MSILATVLGILAVAAIISFAGAWIFMLLWNWIAVGLFSAPVLTFWYAFGLCALLSIIGGFFKSVTSGGSS